MTASLSILVAEDEEIDVDLLRRAFAHAEVSNPVHFVRDGAEAIDFLSRVKNQPKERLPALVLLDLKMPRRTGLQVLAWMREEPVIRSVPVFILSSSNNQNDVEAAYDAGANGYLVKPPSTAERREVARFIKDWLRLNQPPLTAAESFHAAQVHRLNHSGPA